MTTEVARPECKTAVWAVRALAAAIFVFYFGLYEGTGLDYWDTYIAAPATFIAGRPAVLTDESGRPFFVYEDDGRLPGDLKDDTRYGIVSKDQRIGAAVMFTPAYRLFGMFGFRLLYAALGMAAFLTTAAAGRRLFRSEPAAVAAGLIVALNPYLMLMNRLNANFIAVPIAMGMAALLLDDRPRWWIAGLVYGALGGVRNEMIVVAPALAVFIATRKGGAKALAGFGAGALLGVAPYLAWNHAAFGKALIHASQFSDFEGWRPVFPHAFLGFSFEINGLFNWPFHDALVRTPHYPFPTYLTLPLTFALCFGVAPLALSFVGAWAMGLADRRKAALLVGWIALWLALFVFQENWEEPKNTFGAMAVGPIALLVVAGAMRLITRPRTLRPWAAWAAAVVVVKLLILGASYIHVPADERWYVRFPKAKAETTVHGCLRDEQRREWMFFHTDECDAELLEQRIKLTRGSLFPRPYYPIRIHAVDVGAEWGAFRPHIFDIWGKIYGR